MYYNLLCNCTVIILDKEDVYYVCYCYTVTLQHTTTVENFN